MESWNLLQAYAQIILYFLCKKRKNICQTFDSVISAPKIALRFLKLAGMQDAQMSLMDMTESTGDFSRRIWDWYLRTWQKPGVLYPTFFWSPSFSIFSPSMKNKPWKVLSTLWNVKNPCRKGLRMWWLWGCCWARSWRSSHSRASLGGMALFSEKKGAMLFRNSVSLCQWCLCAV